MTTVTRIVGFALGLVVVFVLALGLGRVVGPVGEPPAAHAGSSGGGAGSADLPAAGLPGGLTISDAGYTLRLSAPTAPAGRDVPVSFAVTGPDGTPVTDYEVEHEKELHLIAVRRDFTGYQHVHPTLRADGTWSAALDLEPGVWRLFADFTATGAGALTLGTDLSVPGTAALAAPVGETRTVTVDGYTVSITGDLVAGQDADLSFSVRKDGAPVADLQPYLGAYGHLVALRQGDLAYLHVHPDGAPGDGRTRPGPDVVFHASVPTAGAYRLYLDFQHDGVVRTAPLSVTAHGSAAPAEPAPASSGTTSDHGDDH